MCLDVFSSAKCGINVNEHKMNTVNLHYITTFCDQQEPMSITRDY